MSRCAKAGAKTINGSNTAMGVARRCNISCSDRKSLTQRRRDRAEKLRAPFSSLRLCAFENFYSFLRRRSSAHGCCFRFRGRRLQGLQPVGPLAERFLNVLEKIVELF